MDPKMDSGMHVEEPGNEITLAQLLQPMSCVKVLALVQYLVRCEVSECLFAMLSAILFLRENPHGQMEFMSGSSLLQTVSTLRHFQVLAKIAIPSAQDVACFMPFQTENKIGGATPFFMHALLAIMLHTSAYSVSQVLSELSYCNVIQDEDYFHVRVDQDFFAPSDYDALHDALIATRAVLQDCLARGTRVAQQPDTTAVVENIGSVDEYVCVVRQLLLWVELRGVGVLLSLHDLVARTY